MLRLALALLVASWAGAAMAKSPVGLHDGFEAGRVIPHSLGGVWKGCGRDLARWECGHVVAQSSIVRSGSYAANITLHPGDIASGDSERDELDSGKYDTYDKSLWYGWSFLLPHGFEQQQSSDRLVIAQWKQAGDAAGGMSPPLSMRYQQGRWWVAQRLENGYEKVWQLPHLVLGQWHDVIFHVRFSGSEDEGLVQMWVNGKQTINFAGRTCYTAAGSEHVFYNKIGLYRDKWPRVWWMLLDNYEVGLSYQDVDPASYQHRHPHHQR